MTAGGCVDQRPTPLLHGMKTIKDKRRSAANSL